MGRVLVPLPRRDQTALWGKGGKSVSLLGHSGPWPDTVWSGQGGAVRPTVLKLGVLWYEKASPWQGTRKAELVPEDRLGSFLVRSEMSRARGLRPSPSVLHGIGLHRHSWRVCPGGQEILGTTGGSERWIPTSWESRKTVTSTVVYRGGDCTTFCGRTKSQITFIPPPCESPSCALITIEKWVSLPLLSYSYKIQISLWILVFSSLFRFSLLHIYPIFMS